MTVEPARLSESKLTNCVQVDSVQVNAGGHQTQVSVTEVTINSEVNETEHVYSNASIHNNSLHTAESYSQSHDQSSPGDPVNDVGIWAPVLDKEISDFWIRNETEKLQNCEAVLFEDRSVKQTETHGEKKWYRKCSLSMFERRNKNSEVVKRSWLCFSLQLRASCTALPADC